MSEDPKDLTSRAISMGNFDTYCETGHQKSEYKEFITKLVKALHWISKQPDSIDICESSGDCYKEYLDRVISTKIEDCIEFMLDDDSGGYTTFYLPSHGTIRQTLDQVDPYKMLVVNCGDFDCPYTSKTGVVIRVHFASCAGWSGHLVADCSFFPGSN